MKSELPHYLRAVRALALISATAGAGGGGCGGSGNAPPVVPVASTDDAGSASATEAGQKTTQVDDGEGPCRCSWEKDAMAAPRVCRKGETSHDGKVCVPAARPKYPVVVGPLPPPDLAFA